MQDKVISFIQPSRNNLSYLEWSYNSIRKNLGYRHEIMFGDDYSDDGTWEWLQKIKKKDPNVQIFLNAGPERRGIVYWYDFLCEKATNDIVMFFHADMYACPGLDEEVLKHLEKGKAVSATRIEPPLHPDGPEKILADYGIEPEEFQEIEFLRDLPKMMTMKRPNETTEGIFAPWAIYKDDYWKTGGHDKLFAPQSKEDSDIFNRLHLLGIEFVQTWRGFVYHMTSRGSRFNPSSGGAPGKDSPEWLYTTTKNMRNFIRKWGTVVKHDKHMKPVVSPKYDIGFVAYRCNKQLLKELEPWCSVIYLDSGSDYMSDYIKEEQPNTDFDLSERIKLYGYSKISELHDVCVEFDCDRLNNENFQIIANLADIIKDSGDIGVMEYDIFKFYISSLKSYEKDLILVK
jgi:glycosyltransferase involved in cell wall biosynthesis